MPKALKTVAAVIVALAAFVVVGVFLINIYVKSSAKNYIVDNSTAAKLGDIDCVIVLGCGVHDNGKPSAMLKDRLTESVALYDSGVSDKLLMSGDHGRKDYDEVNAMKSFAESAGVPSSDIFMDHAGFSTYETMYRAKDVFLAKRVVIVTQQYHLYRAVYIARSLGLDAYGVAAEPSIVYYRQWLRDAREFIARAKDFAYCVFKPRPTYLGDAIPVSGDGDITNDK